MVATAARAPGPSPPPHIAYGLDLALPDAHDLQVVLLVVAHPVRQRLDGLLRAVQLLELVRQDRIVERHRAPRRRVPRGAPLEHNSCIHPYIRICCMC